MYRGAIVPTATIELDLSGLREDLHPAQQQIWDSNARYKIVGCGRRFGKTHLAVSDILYHALTVPESLAWWVAPVYDQANIGLRQLEKSLPPGLATINRTHKLVTFKHNGARVQFKSADRPEGLRGEGLNKLVVDEAAFLAESIWYGELFPMLTDRRGSALLIGTFNGDNWFYEEWLAARTAARPNWASWRFKTLDNPYIDPEMVEAARRTRPRAYFMQEYEADPLVFVGAVFDGYDVERAVQAGIVWREKRGDVPSPSLDVVAGIDWGFNNPTAFEVANVDADDKVHWMVERLWHATELNIRCKYIADFCKSYKVRALYADAAGADENFTLEEHLYNATADTMLIRVPFNKYKQAGIEARRWYLERGRESISPECPTLAHDTRRYHYKEDKDDVEKEDDHTVDACTAVYAVMFGDVAGRD
jgi:hypothetical protein